MRPAQCVLLLMPLLLLLAACGGDDEVLKGARVRVLTSPVDGPVQGTVRIEALDGDLGTVYDMQLVSANDPEVFVAPGAPPGRYRVFSSAGWGMLWAGTAGASAPTLHDHRFPAMTVRLGKPHTLYVAADDPSIWRVGLEWGAEWKRQAAGDGQGFERLPVHVVNDVKDALVSLHFGPKYWRGGNVLRALGRMQSGAVTQMLTFIIRDTEHAEFPRLALVHGAIPAPLTVHLVPPPGAAQVADGVPVTVSLLGVPLDVVYEAPSHRGRARFDAVAALGHGLRVSLPRSGAQAHFEVDPEMWRTRGSLYAVAVDPTTAQSVLLPEGDSPVVEVRVRYAQGGGDFGLVSFERVEQGGQGAAGPHVAVRTHAGWQDWLVRRADGHWLHFPCHVESSQDARNRSVVEAPPDGVRSCRIRGTVRRAGLGFHVQFTLLLDAVEGSPLGARRARGEGFSAAISHQGAYEARLPPGRYEITVHGRTGRPSRAPLTLPLRPGGETLLDLEMQ